MLSCTVKDFEAAFFSYMALGSILHGVGYVLE